MATPGTLKLVARDWFRHDAQAVTVEPRAPQQRFCIHEHEFGEIVIVLSGNGWHVLDDEPQLITCGEVFYLAPQDRHGFEQVNDLHLVNVIYRPNDRLLRPEQLRRLFQPAGAGARRRWQLDEDALGRLAPLLAQLTREARSDDPLADVMAESLFLQLVVALRRDRYAIDGDHLPPPSRFGHALTYLRHHCCEDVDLDEVARRFGFSPRGFGRAFREATATTPHHYLVQLRLGRAMHALRTTADAVADVAFASGFHDSNYFSSCFSKMTGLSPSEYRRRSRGGGVEPHLARDRAPSTGVSHAEARQERHRPAAGAGSERHPG